MRVLGARARGRGGSPQYSRIAVMSGYTSAARLISWSVFSKLPGNVSTISRPPSITKPVCVIASPRQLSNHDRKARRHHWRALLELASGATRKRACGFGAAAGSNSLGGRAGRGSAESVAGAGFRLEALYCIAGVEAMGSTTKRTPLIWPHTVPLMKTANMAKHFNQRTAGLFRVRFASGAIHTGVPHDCWLPRPVTYRPPSSTAGSW